MARDVGGRVSDRDDPVDPERGVDLSQRPAGDVERDEHVPRKQGNIARHETSALFPRDTVNGQKRLDFLPVKIALRNPVGLRFDLGEIPRGVFS